MSLFMMIYLLREQLREALIGLAIMLVGLAIYLLSVIFSPSPKAKTG